MPKWESVEKSSGHVPWQVNSCEKNSPVVFVLQMEKSTGSSRCKVFFRLLLLNEAVER